MEEEAIIIVGRRLNGEVPANNYNLNGFGFMPVAFSRQDWLTGEEGEPVPLTLALLTETGPKTFKFEDFDFEIHIPAADWASFSEGEKKTITHILTNYHKSPALTAALKHMSDEGVSVIELRQGAEAYLYDGVSTHPFGNSQSSGQPAAAAISYNSLNGDRTDIVFGSKAIITFNSNFPMNMDTFSKYFIHELIHPYIPDVNGDDHAGSDGVDLATVQVTNEMFPRGPDGSSPSIMNVPDLNIIEGVASMGSAYADTFTGSVNGDFLAGMGGDDWLDGISGNDMLSGGYGMDTLRAGAGYSYLLGGHDADIYIAAGPGTSITIEDTGAVDRVRLPGTSTNVTVNRAGDDLILTSFIDDYTVSVVNHFLDAGRIEVFEFTNGTYAASSVEGLIPVPPTRCYDERGVLIPCGEYLPPVILDLKGNGLSFTDASKSKVRFDVNGDGVLDRVGWIKGSDDVILALDRNGNGTVDGIAEISFLDDLTGAASDLEGLIGLDSDRDGFLTAADDAFRGFLLWNDRNGNGRSDNGELIGLEEAGIASIGLEIFDRVSLDNGADSSQILGRSTVTFTNGREVTAYDVALQTEIVRASPCGCGGMGEDLMMMKDSFYVV